MFTISLSPVDMFLVVAFATILVYILFAEAWIFFYDSGIETVWKPILIVMILQALVLAGWIFID